MSDHKRAVIYTRVSRDDTGEGKSNQRQEADCRTLAQLRGWDVIGVESDISVSAYSGKHREGWAQVLNRMRAGEVDIVLAWHMDRITRTVRELTDIISISRETGVGIATVNGDIDLSNDTGKMVATILGAVAEAEVERKGARQKAANAQRRSEGKRWSSGWRPFGYEMDGSLIEAEAALIRQAADDVLQGTPLREVARRWRESGVSTPRSQLGSAGWTHQGVKSILLNPRNAALNTYKGEIVGAGDWEPVFSEETHTLLVALLTNPSRRTSRPGRSPANLLSGIAECATCGERVTGGTVGRSVVAGGRRVKTGERIPVYKCPNSHLSTDRAAADNIVCSAFAFTVRSWVRSPLLMPLDGDETDAEESLAEAERITSSLKALAVSHAEGRITLTQMETASEALQRQLRAVEEKVREGSSNGANPNQLLQKNMQKFLALGTQERRQLLARFAKIKLYPKGRGRRNVPIKHQVTMELVAPARDGGVHRVHALNERPADLPEVNTEPQNRERAR